MSQAIRGRPRTGQWLGPARLMLRTRKARRVGDPAALLRSVARGNPPAVGARFRGRHLLLLVDPALVGELLIAHAGDTTKGPGMERTKHLLGNGLLTSEGADHRRARRLVAPAFSPRRLAGYVDGFAERTAAHIATWSDGAEVDMHAEMATLTTDIVGRTLLGIDLSDRTGGVRAALEAALAHFAATRPDFNRQARDTASPDEVGVDTEALDSVHRLVDEIVEQRRRNPSDDRGDVVSALLAAAREPDGLTEAEVHDNVITLLMAGHETTANALSWTLHLLGAHPHTSRTGCTPRWTGCPACRPAPTCRRWRTPGPWSPRGCAGTRRCGCWGVRSPPRWNWAASAHPPAASSPSARC